MTPEQDVLLRRWASEGIPWWLCPNEPRCSHGSFLHDIDDYDDPVPRCCFEGCSCGAIHGPVLGSVDLRESP